MLPAGLHWFRHKQRSLARVVLAVFCVTWLQLAAMPCVMAFDGAFDNRALDAEAGVAAQSTVTTVAPVASMPEGMEMAPGEHCPYCPPSTPLSQQGVDLAACSFPHDPQVDSRASFAAALLAPPPAVVLFVVTDASRVTTDFVAAPTPAPQPTTSLAVSLCRFLK